jgi:hypothetical protein
MVGQRADDRPEAWLSGPVRRSITSSHALDGDTGERGSPYRF